MTPVAPQPPDREPLAASSDEPLPPSPGAGTTAAGAGRPAAGTEPAGDAEPGYRISPAGPSFAAGFARRHFFSGIRFLKPGRRVAVAVAGVVGVAAVGVGLAAGVSHFGGHGHVDAQPAASARALVTPSASATTPGRSGAPRVPASPKAPAGPPAKHAPAPPASPPGRAFAPPVRPASPPSGTTPATPGTPKPSAHPVTFQGAFIVNFASNRCLAGQGGSRAAGTQMVLADCNRDDPSQGWTFASDGTARDFGGTMCLDVSGTPGDGTTVHLAACSAARHSTQAFVLKPSYDLVEVQPDLCVDAKDQNTAAGTVLQMWTCAGTANQKWRMP
jgi:hypothetical protein